MGKYSPRGDSPYGCADMAGNVWEWTSSLFQHYPYRADDGREDMTSSADRVLRGGAYYSNLDDVRCAFRSWCVPVSRFDGIGFRVARSSL